MYISTMHILQYIIFIFSLRKTWGGWRRKPESQVLKVCWLKFNNVDFFLGPKRIRSAVFHIFLFLSYFSLLKSLIGSPVMTCQPECPWSLSLVVLSFRWVIRRAQAVSVSAPGCRFPNVPCRHLSWGQHRSNSFCTRRPWVGFAFKVGCIR